MIPDRDVIEAERLAFGDDAGEALWPNEGAGGGGIETDLHVFLLVGCPSKDVRLNESVIGILAGAQRASYQLAPLRIVGVISAPLLMSPGFDRDLGRF
jgi:hypothetical protein